MLLGENGSGKTNFIEALELLSAAPRDFAARVRAGGGAEWWRWQGAGMENASPTLEVVLDGDGNPAERPLRYRLAFDAVGGGTEIVEETLQDAEPREGAAAALSYYSLREGRVLDAGANGRRLARPIRSVGRGEPDPGQSVLARLRDADRFPELVWVGERLAAIRSSREWSFGLDAPVRRAQSADLPGDGLAPDARNLAAVLSRLDPANRRRVDELTHRFFIRSEGLSTEASNGSAMVRLRERDFPAPLPPARLSDGTLRFITTIAALLSREAPSVLCIDEPENGLHTHGVIDIAREIVDASQDARTRQLVVATQSDMFLSAMTGESKSVVTCDRLRGSTVMDRLGSSELEEIDRLSDRYMLGEMRQIGVLGSV